MISLVPGQVSSVATPQLTFLSASQGQVVPAAALTYKIFDVTTDALEMSGGNLVFSGTVDLVHDLIPFDSYAYNGGGYYVAKWTVPSDAARGRYEIEWTYTLTQPSSSTFTTVDTETPPHGVVRKRFEVLRTRAPAVGGTPYALVSDMRDELGCEQYSDGRLYRALALASRYIDRVTGRTFAMQSSYLREGGNSARRLLLGPAIIAVSSVGIDTEPTQSGDLVVELDMLRIYNRHLSQGLTDPDDRENPMLEFVHSDDLYGVRFIPFRGISLRSLAWPIGVQNIHVRGFFGYTDPDGSPWGETPLLIQKAAKLLALRELPKLADTDARNDARWGFRVTRQRTRDIEIDLDKPIKWGEFTGDPEIDQILASYTRPPKLGSV